MVLNRVLSGLLLLSVWFPGFASGQYLFLDTNGDSICSSSDRLSATASATVSIWISTDKNRDGSRAISATRSSIPLSIFSYEFLLHASGGTVEWGPYTNLQPTMDFQLAEYKNKTDYYTGFAGNPPLPPGKYKLGTLVARVTSGAPRIQFVSHNPLWYWVQTSFGSMNPGKDGNNALRYTDDPSKLGSPISDVPGDWGDADGVATSGIQLAVDKEPTLRFGVSIVPNPLNPGATITITTTRSGFIRVRLFDVAGRLVGVLMNNSSAPPGRHTVQLNAVGKRPSELASGVYYYRVEATEGVLSGRLVIAK